MDIVGLEMKPLHVGYFGIAASIKTAAFSFTFQCIPLASFGLLTEPLNLLNSESLMSTKMHRRGAKPPDPENTK